jgi:hypothetical protein
VSEPTVSVATYVRSNDGGDVLVAHAEAHPGRRELLTGAIAFEVTYRAGFRTRITDDIDFIWPFLGAALAQFVETGRAVQPTSFGDTFTLSRDRQRGRALLAVTTADGASHRVSLLESNALVVLASEARHVAQHLIRLTGDGGLARSASATLRGLADASTARSSR